MATSLLAAIFVCIGLGDTAFAVDAYRVPNGFSYEGKQFTTEITLPAGDARNPYPQEIFAYQHFSNNNATAEYIFFTDSTTIPTVTTALYSTFDYTPPSTYKKATGPQIVTLSNNPPPGQAQPQPAEPIVEPSPQNANAGTCQVPAIGWIVCPVTSQLAAMIDGVYEVLMQFLDVKPMLQGGPIFDVWDAVRNIANICFVIAFLVIIYSQVTSLGISSYGVKKMLPRLIIAAILVNVSYWICALGVDVSNFLGHSVYRFLISFATSLNGFNVEITWSSLADGILGGTAAAGIVVGAGLFAVSTAGSLAAALFTLAGMLISVIIAAVTALFILMARQALIVVFTIISPLAFVALVLPKTEKWFDKWKDTFMAMLIMFPIFSLVFGGAVLAGAAIIAGANNNIFLILLGKGTQLMPLAITPLIVKFSTGVLGTIAQFTNNKNKGLVDRAKNWTGSQAEYHRKKSLANNSTFGRYNPARRFARYMNNRDVRQQRDIQRFDMAAEDIARNKNGFKRSDILAREEELRKDTTDNNLKASWDDARRNGYSNWRGRTITSPVETEIANRKAQVNAKEQSERLERMHADIVAEGSGNTHLQGLGIKNVKLRQAMLDNASAIKLSSEQVAFEGMGKRLAEAEHKSNTTERLNRDESLRKEIGRIRGNEGAELVHATAIAEERKQYGEFVSARQEIMKHFKITSEDTANLAMGIDVPKTRDDGTQLTFKATDQYTREAAIENIFQVGSANQVRAVIESTGVNGINYDYRSTALAAFQKNGKSKSLPFINDKAYDIIQKGEWNGEVTTREQVVRRVVEGRMTASDLAGSHASAIQMFFDTGNASTEWSDARQVMIGSDPTKLAEYNKNYRSMLASAVEVLRDPDLRESTSTESVNVIKSKLGVNVASLDGYDWDALERRWGLK